MMAPEQEEGRRRASVRMAVALAAIAAAIFFGFIWLTATGK
jgi:hypothetical protein